MSIETRMALANNPRLVCNAEQRAQLIDTKLTNTYLIAFLVDLVATSPRPILITALNTDHKSGTWHNPAGRAVDYWHADWATVGDDKIVEVMKAAATVGFKYNPAMIEMGLSGTAAHFKTYVTWPLENVFIESWSVDNEHLHTAVGVPT